MAKTGESYAAARSRLLADYPGTVPGDSRPDWMPGRSTSATTTSREPGSRGAIYWRDALHEGPVPDVAPDELH